MTLEKGEKYNVIYEYKGWLGNFSSEFLREDSYNYYFSDGVINKMMIIMAIKTK